MEQFRETYSSAEEFFEGATQGIQVQIKEHLEQNKPIHGECLTAVILEHGGVHKVVLTARCVRELLDHWEIC